MYRLLIMYMGSSGRKLRLMIWNYYEDWVDERRNRNKNFRFQITVFTIRDVDLYFFLCYCLCACFVFFFTFVFWHWGTFLFSCFSCCSLISITEWLTFSNLWDAALSYWSWFRNDSRVKKISLQFHCGGLCCLYVFDYWLSVQFGLLNSG